MGCPPIHSTDFDSSTRILLAIAMKRENTVTPIRNFQLRLRTKLRTCFIMYVNIQRAAYKIHLFSRTDRVQMILVYIIHIIGHLKIRSIYSIRNLTHLNVPSKMTSTLFSTHNVGRLYDWLGLIALVFVVLGLVDHVFTRTLLSIAAITTGYIYLFFAGNLCLVC